LFDFVNEVKPEFIKTMIKVNPCLQG
jgi:hypothetical protein